MMMKTATKIINIIDKILTYSTYIFLVCIMALGIYALYDNYAVKESAKLDEDIIKLSPEVLGDEAFSLESLMEINEDIVGWIKVDDTNIDYPIVLGEDNSEYLNTNYKGEYATAGSVFLDYRNNRNFKDDYSIIYGHNMSAGLMFSDVKRFSNIDYFNIHKKGKLYTREGIYELDIYLYSYVNAFSNDAYNLLRIGNNANNYIINYFKQIATHTRDYNINSNSKLLLLSTCDTTGSTDRNVILATMTLIKGTKGDDIIHEEGDNRLSEIDKENTTTTIPITTRNVEVKRVKKYISIRLVLIIISIILVVSIFLILLIRIYKRKVD